MSESEACMEPSATDGWPRSQATRSRPPSAVLLALLAILGGWWGGGQPAHATSAELTNPRRVLILFTARPNLPINVQWERGIRTGVKQLYSLPVAFDCEYIDFDRLQSPEYREQWLSLLRAKYASAPPDLIIPVHDLASRYFATAQPEIFPQSQVVFCSINEETLSLLPLQPRMTGVTYRFEYQRTLELARELVPRARQVIVIGGASEMDQDLLQAAQTHLDKQDANDITYWVGLPLDEICDRVAKLGPEHVILFLSLESDRNGQMTVSSYDAAQAISAATAVPIFGLFDSLIGTGVVGGQMGRVEEQGVRVGTIAGRLLLGESPASIPFSGIEMNRPMFDDRQLQRWRIPDRALPADAIVLHRTPSLWAQYGTTLILIGTIIGAQCLLIIGLLFNRRQRRLAQDELREMLEFQTAFCHISSTLLDHSPDIPLLELDHAIKRFSESVGLAYCAVWRMDGDSLEVLSQRTPDRLEAANPPQTLMINSIPTVWGRVTRGERVPFSAADVRDRGEQTELACLFPQDQKSGMLFPLRDNQRELGLIVFGVADSHARWHDRLLDRLGMFADLISQFIARTDALQALANSRSEARRLAGNLLTAQEDERRRISREIHDDICQRLVAAGMQVRNVEQAIDKPTAALTSLGRLSDCLVDLSRDVQHLARKLHPAILDELGLADAIRSECNRLAEAGYLQVTFQCLPLPDKIDKRAALCLYRILQESLWNVVKHADTKHAQVRLSSDAEALYLEVTDRGRGFKAKRSNLNTGLGLVSFRERVRLLAGKIEISSAPNQGTKILVMLPITEDDS